MGSVHSDTVPSASPAASRRFPSQASDVTGCGCGSAAVSERVARFHTSTLASAVPAATAVPSGLNADGEPEDSSRLAVAWGVAAVS